MKKCLAVLGAAALFAAACSKSAPLTPSSPAASGTPSGTQTSTAAAKASVSVTAPTPVSPAANAQITFAQQPITLTIKNAASTSTSAVTYSFQVATDSGFANIAFTKDGVAEGSGGQTSLVITKLAGKKDYFWRANAVVSGTAGPASATRGFSVGPEVVIQAPALVSPADGGATGQGPLVVTNATRTGPAGSISYKFEVADSSSFGKIVFSKTVAEGSGQTSVTLDVNLTTGATYYWRVTATDTTNAVSSPVSSTSSFKYAPFDISQAIMVNGPQDFASWPETAKITSIQFDPNYFAVDFDKRDGPDRWPDMIPTGFAGALEYTLGMCVNINNQWYCSGVVQFWYGRDLGASAPPSHVGFEWFYPPRWGPMTFYQPQDGELVGLFVAAGNLRDGSDLSRATCPAVCERSNIALVPWENFGNSLYSFSKLRSLFTR